MTFVVARPSWPSTSPQVWARRPGEEPRHGLRPHHVAAAWVLVLAPLVVLVLLRPESRLEEVATASGLVAYPAVFLAASVSYVQWRLGRGAAVGWLTLALMLTATLGTVESALMLTRWRTTLVDGGWGFVVLLVLGAALLMTTRITEQRRLRADPGALGLGIGVLLAVGIAGAASHTGPVRAPGPHGLLLGTALVVVGWALVRMLMRLDDLEPGARRRLTVVVPLLSVGQGLVMVLDRGAAGDLVVVVTSTGCAALLLVTTATMLHTEIQLADTELVRLQALVEEAEAADRGSRARLHEIGSTVAGIASASQTIARSSAIEPRHALLADMMDAELARLRRLLAERTSEPEGFSVDDAVGTIVLSHQARGRQVQWEASGLRALGRSDDLSEVVNILLENAARHCGGADVRVDVHARGALVEITVVDAGPGIDPVVLPLLFGWGAHSATSPGQGIGLHVARQLALQNAGALELVGSDLRGTTFAVTLPSVVMSRAAHGHVA